MGARGIPAESGQVLALAERADLDAEGLAALATSDPATDLGSLDGLDGKLWLSEEQKGLLAQAYAYDRDVVAEAVRRCGTSNDARSVVEDSAEDLAPGAKERILALLAEEREKARAEAERLRASLRGAGS